MFYYRKKSYSCISWISENPPSKRFLRRQHLVPSFNHKVPIKKFSPVLQEKNHHELLWPLGDPSRMLGITEWYHWKISNFIGMELRKSRENISYSIFLTDWTKLRNIKRRGEILKVFSRRGIFTGQIFSGKVPGVDSDVVLRQDVLKAAQKYQLMSSLSRISFSRISFSITKFQLNVGIICV